MRCWLVCAAGYLLVISAYWQFCTEWQDRLITVDMYWQFWQDRLITADMYWQFCAEWQDRPGIITLEIMRAPRADTERCELGHVKTTALFKDSK